MRVKRDIRAAAGGVLLAGAMVLASSNSALRGETWSSFRGATGAGVQSTGSFPAAWSADSGIAWSVELPGRANSSPAVTAERIDLTTQTEDQGLWVLSLDRASGKLLRKTRVGSGTLAAKGAANLYAHRHNAATPTPAADDKHVYAFFGTGLLVCVEAATGEIRWKHDLVDEFGAYDITFGMGSSPRLWGDHLYLACMTKGPSYVLALEKSTGKVLWKTARKLPAKDDGPDAYSTPTIRETAARTEVLVSGSDHVDAYDARTGKQVWVSGGLTIDSPYGRVIASPVAEDGIVVATSGNPGGGGRGHLLAVRAGQGNVSESGFLWKYPKTTPDSSTPVIVDGRLYTVTDAGVATCLDLRAGKVLWQKRLAKGPYHASLVAADGKVYFLGIEGDCTVIEAGSDPPKILSVNKLPGTFYATPALSDGTVYLRSYERLFAVTGSK